MSRIWKACLMAILASGLLVAGCDNQSGDDRDEKKRKQSEAKEPEESADDEQAEAEEEEREADYSRENYVQASAALSCIDSKLGDDAIEDRQKVEENMLGKYGFDRESYAAAEEEFSDDEEVTARIDSELEDCDEKQARKLAGLADESSDNEEKTDEGGDDRAQAEPKPAYVGSLSGSKSDFSNFDRAKLTVTVSDDFSANGDFKGSREKGFRISLDGEVSKDNKLKLSGSEGKNEVNVEGRLKASGTRVEVSGTLWEKDFSTTMKLN